MKLFGTLQKTEVKRAIRVLPQYFLGVFVLILLIGIVALFGFLSNKKETSESMTVALVLGNNEFLSTMGMQILDGAKSADGLCSFDTCDSEDLALERLRDGTYTAVIVFPDSFVSKALYRDDAEASIYIPVMSSFHTSLLRSLADSAGALLKDTEANITTVSVYAREQGISDSDRSTLDNEINTALGSYALAREDFFIDDTANGTGTVGTVPYYFNAAIVMLLLLGGISCGPLLAGDSRAYRDQLIHHRIGPLRQLFAKCLAVLTLFASLYLVIFLGITAFKAVKPDLFTSLLKLETYGEIGYWFLCGLPILFLATAMVVLIYTFAANQIGGILLLFLVTILMGYASGCIEPSAFLPLTVRNFGSHLPMTKMFNSILSGIRGEADRANIAAVFLWGLGCFFVSGLITWGRRVRES